MRPLLTVPRFTGYCLDAGLTKSSVSAKPPDSSGVWFQKSSCESIPGMGLYRCNELDGQGVSVIARRLRREFDVETH